MNIPNIQALAARLRAPATEGHFVMRTFFRRPTAEWGKPIGQNIHVCGTVACIAGFASIMAHPEMTENPESDAAALAANWMGIDPTTARQLFIPDTSKVSYNAVTASIAAGVLDRLIETGTVIWPSSVLR